MNSTAIRFHDLRSALEQQAIDLAATFMSSRSIRGRVTGDWSDLSLRVKVRDGRLLIEWRKKVWLSRASASKGKGLRYVPKHLTSRALLASAKSWERDEVVKTRERLGALQTAHRSLLRMESRLTRLGLTGDGADLEAGFIPQSGQERRRTAAGRFSAKRGGTAGQDQTDTTDAPHGRTA